MCLETVLLVRDACRLSSLPGTIAVTVGVDPQKTCLAVCIVTT